MIDVQHLSKQFGGFQAVKDISFQVGAGDILGFIGPNGAGKTTTMRMLTTFLPPSSGTATLCGFDIMKDSWEIRKIVGYLPETPPLYPELTIGRYLRFIAELHNLSEPRKKVGAVMERLGLSGWENRIIRSLSKGYKQRVGLAQAIIHDPKILILDEPTTGLDPTQVVGIRKFISHLAEDRTVILSTHILSEVEKLCNRAVIIKKGHCVAEGTVAELGELVGGRSLLLGIEGEGNPQTVLATLDGVNNVEVLSQEGDTFQLKLKTAGMSTSELVQFCVGKNWKLSQVSEYQPSMEDIFLGILGEEK